MEFALRLSKISLLFKCAKQGERVEQVGVEKLLLSSPRTMERILEGMLTNKLILGIQLLLFMVICLPLDFRSFNWLW